MSSSFNAPLSGKTKEYNYKHSYNSGGLIEESEIPIGNNISKENIIFL